MLLVKFCIILFIDDHIFQIISTDVHFGINIFLFLRDRKKCFCFFFLIFFYQSLFFFYDNETVNRFRNISEFIVRLFFISNFDVLKYFLNFLIHLFQHIELKLWHNS